MKKQSFRMPFFSVQISAVYIVQFKVMLILVSIDILLTSQKSRAFSITLSPLFKNVLISSSATISG